MSSPVDVDNNTPLLSSVDIMTIRLVCECSEQATLAQVRGIADPESPLYEHALDAVWKADWHYMPNLDWQQGLREMPLAEDASDLKKDVRAFMIKNTKTLTWEVNCPRKGCQRNLQGHTEDLVLLVQRALAEGVRTVTLTAELLHELGKETRSFVVYYNRETLEVVGYGNGSSDADGRP